MIIDFSELKLKTDSEIDKELQNKFCKLNQVNKEIYNRIEMFPPELKNDFQE